jgi:hypothetical protein
MSALRQIRMLGSLLAEYPKSAVSRTYIFVTTGRNTPTEFCNLLTLAAATDPQSFAGQQHWLAAVTQAALCGTQVLRSHMSELSTKRETYL